MSQLLRQRTLTSVSIALCAGGALTAIGLYFGALQPNVEHKVATVERSLLAERAARSQAQQGEERSRLRADELNAQLSSLRQTLEEERERRATPPLAPSSARKAPAAHAPNALSVVKPCRDDGDPLNPCLKR
ncbi:MAG TPA: hypothetical protein VFK05_38490 [Polyangiaceae bacterium]|nr:hypothetical protein [Polyangiaceae bacterium]